MDKLLPLRDEWFEQHPRPASRETYERHLRTFLEYCAARGIDQPDQLTDQVLLQYPPTLLDQYAGATVSLKIIALKDYLGFLEDRDLVSIRWTRLQRQWKRLPRGDRHHVILDQDGIHRMIDYCLTAPAEDIIQARNIAWVVWLADTGLRVHEACKLKRGDIDWAQLSGVIVGKRRKTAPFKISQRAADMVQRYLSRRAQLDADQAVPLYRLPIFARHDDGAGKKVLHMTPTTGRNITADMVQRILGGDADPLRPITPHKFRHYLIDLARRSGGLLFAKAVGRHDSIQTTEGYFHLDAKELDQGYRELFDEPS